MKRPHTFTYFPWLPGNLQDLLKMAEISGQMTSRIIERLCSGSARPKSIQEKRPDPLEGGINVAGAWKDRPFCRSDRALYPGPTVQDDVALMEVISSTLGTYMHTTSTAPMGGDRDASAVVDWRGAVRGVEDLRVVDASIFPEVPSTPTNLTTIMVAEHIAARIIARNLI